MHPKESHEVHMSTLRAKLRRPDQDLLQLRCNISHLVELAYPNDPPDILNSTARDFLMGALSPITLNEMVLDLGPSTLDEALAAAQQYESNRKMLSKGRLLECCLLLVIRRSLAPNREPKNPQRGLRSFFNSKLKS